MYIRRSIVTLSVNDGELRIIAVVSSDAMKIVSPIIELIYWPSSRNNIVKRTMVNKNIVDRKIVIFARMLPALRI